MAAFTCFIIMPFKDDLKPVYAAVQHACQRANIHPIRADKIERPGPIINQIFNAITAADFVIAEISERNPNVYYEVGIAHCENKPTILLATKDSISGLPFDIRHNRVLVYDTGCLEEILLRYLDNLKDVLRDVRIQTIDSYLDNLTFGRGGRQTIVEQMGIDFDLVRPRLLEMTPIPEGLAITVQDVLGEKVSAIINHNGVITRARRR